MIRQLSRKPLAEARRARWRARISAVSRGVSDERLTYLSYRSLHNLERCVKTVRDDGVPGILLEAGVALGGSAIVIASLMPSDRAFHGYDVFGMIPPPGENDDETSHERYAVIASGKSRGIRGDSYYGYDDDLYRRVQEHFGSYGVPVDGEHVVLHRGLFEDTLRLNGQQIALAHLDGDWYESVQICLDRIYPHLSRGGFIISDDYYAYGGCARAVDEFLATYPDMDVIDDGHGDPSASANLVMRKSW